MNGSLDFLIVTNDLSAEDLADGIEVGQVMSTAHMIPGLWKIDGYGPFIDRLCNDLKIEVNSNFFLFPYDWAARQSGFRRVFSPAKLMHGSNNGAGLQALLTLAW